ncbi:MAG: 2-C-methyl-D-erythritol 4-phosphate cytidylyltransferase [Acidaminococcaceae bacterium]|nr:2-C-methyl-D-erythritol 4-phosphate cytidylyltransferase [Acidaminococcaceae bacterium]
MKDYLTVIVPAAGVGKRLGLGKNKAFACIGGMPLLILCMKMLAETGLVRNAVVVVGAGEVSETEALINRYQPEHFATIEWKVAVGGKERQDSVANGLALVTDTEGYVAVHDGARPFAGRDVFLRTLEKARQCGSAIAAVPVKNTIKVTDSDGYVVSTLERSSLCAVQTPQIFEVNILRKAYAYLKEHPFAVTDDASLAEAAGYPVAVAEGSYENIKVTTPEDLLLAEEILRKRRVGGAGELPGK